MPRVSIANALTGTELSRAEVGPDTPLVAVLRERFPGDKFVHLFAQEGGAMVPVDVAAETPVGAADLALFALLAPRVVVPRDICCVDIQPSRRAVLFTSPRHAATAVAKFVQWFQATRAGADMDVVVVHDAHPIALARAANNFADALVPHVRAVVSVGKGAQISAAGITAAERVRDGVEACGVPSLWQYKTKTRSTTLHKSCLSADVRAKLTPATTHMDLTDMYYPHPFAANRAVSLTALPAAVTTPTSITFARNRPTLVISWNAERARAKIDNVTRTWNPRWFFCYVATRPRDIPKALRTGSTAHAAYGVDPADSADVCGKLMFRVPPTEFFRHQQQLQRDGQLFTMIRTQSRGDWRTSMVHFA